MKPKGKTVTADNGKEREEITPSPTKPKNKKQLANKKDNQVEKSRFVKILKYESVIQMSLATPYGWGDHNILWFEFGGLPMWLYIINV